MENKPKKKMLKMGMNQAYMICLECKKEFGQFASTLGQICQLCLDEGYMQIFVLTDND